LIYAFLFLNRIAYRLNQKGYIFFKALVGQPCHQIELF